MIKYIMSCQVKEETVTSCSSISFLSFKKRVENKDIEVVLLKTINKK